MADYTLDIAEFLDQSDCLPVIDVRSPAEYEHGHIPGAVNLPMFSNEERSLVGTLYLQQGSSEAMMKGLELIGPKMKDFASRALEIAPGKKALLHCWRGGMRSKSMAWLLNTMGIETKTLLGGYKNYRSFVQAYFVRQLNLVVIGGMTGSGKTAVLEAIEKKGHQVIHLEQLANHKGSVFGGISMPPQPTNEQFENNLFFRLRSLRSDKPVFTEDESLAIGRIFIPRPFFEQMSKARFIYLNVPAGKRVELLVGTYTLGDPALLMDGVEQLGKRLGLENAARAIAFIRSGEMARAVEVVLAYYDKIYARSMTLLHRQETCEINVEKESTDEIADKIIHVTECPITYKTI